MNNWQYFSEADFDALSWHDCHIWGLEFDAGSADEEDWTSDLVLDIDFIVDWVCGVAGGAQFQVAPADLIFHGVTDLAITIQWSDGAAGAAIHPVSIECIERELVNDQKVFLDRPYYRWRIRLNWPAGGEIAFGAVGFTQTLRAEPRLTPLQHLTRAQRSAVRRHAR